MIGWEELFNFRDSQPLDTAIKKIEELETVYTGMIDSVAESNKRLAGEFDVVLNSAKLLSGSINNVSGSLEKQEKQIMESSKQSEALVSQSIALKNVMNDNTKTLNILNDGLEKTKVAKDGLKKSNIDEAGSYDQLKKKLSEAETAYKKLGDSADGVIKEEQIQKVREASAQFKVVNSALVEAKKAAMVASGSYNEFSQRVAAAKKELKAMEGGLDGTSQEFKDLRKFVDEGSQKLKDWDNAVGDNQRKVGDYKGELKGLSSQMQTIAPGFSSMATGIWNVVKASAAFIATPLGAFLAGLALLFAPIIAFLKGTADGMDAVEAKTSGAKAALTAFKDELAETGKGMIDAGKTFLETAKDSTALKIGLALLLAPIVAMLAPVIALGKGLALLVPDSFKQKLSDAFNAGERLAIAIDQIREAEAKYSVTEKELINQQTELRIQAKNVNLTFDEKIEKLEEAQRIEQEITDKRSEFADAEIKAVADAAAVRLGIQKSDLESYRDYAKSIIDIARAKDDDLADSLIAALNKQTEAEDGQLKIREKIANEIAKLYEGQVKAQAKAAQDKVAETKNAGQSEIEYLTAHELLKVDILKQGGIDASNVQKQIAAKLAADKAADDAKKLQAEKALQDALIQLRQQAFQTANDLANNFFEAESIRIEERKNMLETEMAEEITLAGNNADAKAEIESKYAAKLNELEKEQRALKRKQAVAQKALAAFEISINTAVKASEAGFVTPLAIAIYAIGALQLASVLSKPLPAFAEGTDNAPEGWAVINEKGREIVVPKTGSPYILESKGATAAYLEGGSKVIPADESKRIMEGNAFDDTSGFFKTGDQSINKYLVDRNDRAIVSALDRNFGSLIASNQQIAQAVENNSPPDYFEQGSMIMKNIKKRDGSKKRVWLKSMG